MALNVYNQTFNTAGIDRSVLKEVSQEILKRAAAKNTQFNTSTGSLGNIFSTRDLGVDLYKGNVDAATARQIAQNNSGLNIQLNNNVLASIQYLNTKAAQNVQKNVEGKLTIALNESQGQTAKTETAGKFNSIVSLAAGKDKNGSNPSYKGELLFVKKEKEQNEDNNNNIFNKVW